MPRDTRTYITLHDGMVQNKKILPLTDKAFRTYIELLSWCSRERSDGEIPAAVYRHFGTPSARRSLEISGLVEVGDDLFRIHDYLEHQRSREEIEKLQKARSEAGKLGAAKTNAAAKGSASAAAPDAANVRQSSGKTSAETETETTTTPNGVVKSLAPKAAPSSKGTRIPEPFIVTGKMREWAASEVAHVDVDAATRKFVDHYRSVTGARAVMKDWPAAWRNWLRNEKPGGGQMSNTAGRPSPNGPLARGQQRDRELLEFAGFTNPDQKEISNGR